MLVCFSETFWRFLERQKAYVCVRERSEFRYGGCELWHKENEENKSCREKEYVTSEAVVCGKDQ